MCPDVRFPTGFSATILGVTFTNNCPFKLHVDNIACKDYYSIMTLSSMRRLGFSNRQHQAYPQALLPRPQIQNAAYMPTELDDVQKPATKVMLVPCFNNYGSALELTHVILSNT